MLFLTNFLIIVGVMSVLVSYLFGVIALSEWAGDKWGDKGFNTVWVVFLFLPMMIIHAWAMTYG